ncbi:MAG: PQQ-dependent sugar dehydrogenase, partial [Coriobacteriia bacterium]|nr:PQQ-dependent sugar dehydrogenase [Coriobacteriia bacterium]
APSSPGATPPATTSAVPPTSTPHGGGATEATRPATQPADLAHLHVALVRRWTGFTAPVYITSAHDGSGRLFVVEQPGWIRVIHDGKVASGTFLDVSREVTYGGERGLLGLAFSPSYATNGTFYVDFVDLNGDTIIARCVVRDPASDRPHLNSLTPILRINQPPYPNHKGGCLQFGPDGYLYIGMGDGGSAGDPGNRAQNPNVLLGKLLRIDPEHASGSLGYAIPAGQPMHPRWAPEVFAIGLRNPWRFSFDASSGALWIGDVGQDLWEEIDVEKARVGGQNFGWHVWEGNHPYPPGSTASRSGFVFPIYDYPHPYGEAITGGYVYRGAKYPALVGTYLFADYVKGWVAALRTTAPDGSALASPQTRTLLTGVGQPSSFGVDDAGELYVVDYRGSIFAVTAQAR